MKIADNHNLQCGTVESNFKACEPWVGGVVKSSSLLTAPLRRNSHLVQIGFHCPSLQEVQSVLTT